MSQQMDRIVYEYSSKIRTLQQAIKTQNDMLINKISAIVNKTTIEAFQKLEGNLTDFVDAHTKMKQKDSSDYGEDSFKRVHMKFITQQITIYQEENLKNILNQISQSINSLQPNALPQDQGSSLQDVLQLFLRAGELYSKNLNEIIRLPPPPDVHSPMQAIQQQLNGVDVSSDDRVGVLSHVVEGMSPSSKQKFKCASIYDIHPIKGTSNVLVVTFNNDLLIFDIETQQLIKKLEPLKFAPSSTLVLQSLDLQGLTNDTKIGRSNLIVFGGSELDPIVYIYNMNSGRMLQKLTGHERCVRYLFQLGDISTLMSGGRDNKIFFWDVARAEPLHIQQILTMEVIDLQMNVHQDQVFCLSIDGKISVLQILYKHELNTVYKFDKAILKNFIDISETTQLSQVLWIEHKLVVVCFLSGLLSGVPQIKILKEKSNQTTTKFDKDHSFPLDDEIYQLNTFKITLSEPKLLILAIKKKTGMIIGFLYPDNKEILIQGQTPILQPQNNDPIRWNIKIIKTKQNKLQVVKYGQEDEYQIFDLI